MAGGSEAARVEETKMSSDDSLATLARRASSAQAPPRHTPIAPVSDKVPVQPSVLLLFNAICVCVRAAGRDS